MDADPTTEAGVRSTLDRLADVYVTREAMDMAEVFAPDPDVVMFTPGADAVVGLPAIQAKAERDWSRTEAASLTYRWVRTSAAGPVAWAVTEADFSVTAGGQEMKVPTRITFVLEKRGERWLIQHAHYSFVAPASD